MLLGKLAFEVGKRELDECWQTQRPKVDKLAYSSCSVTGVFSHTSRLDNQSTHRFRISRSS